MLHSLMQFVFIMAWTALVFGLVQLAFNETEIGIVILAFSAFLFFQCWKRRDWFSAS